MAKHVCGVENKEFNTEQEYLDHVCVSGFTPKDPEHLGERFILQSREALKRTGSLKAKQEKEFAEKLAKVKADKVDEKLDRARRKE